MFAVIVIIAGICLGAINGKEQFKENQLNRGVYIFLSFFTVIVSFYINKHGVMEAYTNTLAQLFSTLTNVVINK